MLYEGVSTEAKMYHFAHEMVPIVGNYTHIDWKLVHVYGVGPIFVITWINMFHKEQKRFRIACQKFDQMLKMMH